jgi:hypothetical protein
MSTCMMAERVPSERRAAMYAALKRQARRLAWLSGRRTLHATTLVVLLQRPQI